MEFASERLSTSLAPSWNSKPGKLTGAGATAGAAPAAGGGAAAAIGGGATTALATSAGFGVSTFGSAGFSLGGSGFFSLGTIVTVSCLSFLPNMPSRAAKKKTTAISVPWNMKEKIRLTFDELRFLRWIITLLLSGSPIGERFGGQVHFADVGLLQHVHDPDDALVFGFRGAAHDDV